MAEMAETFEKIKQSGYLPQLPEVTVRLVRACGRDGADTEEISRIISADPALTAKLLETIGSAYVNLPKDVQTIQSAVLYLGIDTIRNIAISSSAMHYFSLAEKLPQFDIKRFWYHSYKCATIAGKLAEEDHFSSPEEFFLAGLLHEIGRLALMASFPDT